MMITIQKPHKKKTFQTSLLIDNPDQVKGMVWTKLSLKKKCLNCRHKHTKKTHVKETLKAGANSKKKRLSSEEKRNGTVTIRKDC